MTVQDTAVPASVEGKRIRSSDPVYGEINDFLIDEAALLDESRFAEWLVLMAVDLHYRMPNRKTVYKRDGTGIDPRNSQFDDDRVSLAHRIKRLSEPTAWERDPAPRTRRFVSNVVAREASEPDEYVVRSNMLLMSSRFDDTHYEMLTAERTDLLRRTVDGLRIARRLIVPDQVTFAAPWVTTFL